MSLCVLHFPACPNWPLVPVDSDSACGLVMYEGLTLNRWSCLEEGDWLLSPGLHLDDNLIRVYEDCLYWTLSYIGSQREHAIMESTCTQCNCRFSSLHLLHMLSLNFFHFSLPCCLSLSYLFSVSFLSLSRYTHQNCSLTAFPFSPSRKRAHGRLLNHIISGAMQHIGTGFAHYPW